MYSKWKEAFGTGFAILFIITALALLLAADFALFTFLYWIITLILSTFFAFMLPFSWWYSFGAWLILVIISLYRGIGKGIAKALTEE